MSIRPLGVYRLLITRVVLAFCLFFLALRGLGGILPAQLQHPILTNFHYDLTMWLFKLSGLAYWITQVNWSSRLFTILLFGFGVLSVIFPLKRAFIIPFSLLFFLLALNFNFYLTHNSHYLAGLVWILPVFWTKREDRFELLWEGLRYFACWIYGVAFIWKLIHGAFFQWDAGLLGARENLAPYLYQNPGTKTAAVYYFLLNHPFLLNSGHKVVALAEGIFLLGFFTKKFDVLLIFLAIFICCSTYFIADVFFAELLVIVFLFFPLKYWHFLKARFNSALHRQNAPKNRMESI